MVDTGNSAEQRKIIHCDCDCDCFYAAVEMRDDPSLQAYPIAIGGKSDRRGVVATVITKPVNTVLDRLCRLGRR